jgi:hypothetical protein
VVLSVREDFLARLLDRPELVGAPAPVVRIGPLTRDGRRAGPASPLAERRIEVEPALIARWSTIWSPPRGPWGPSSAGARAAVFPPHLQLVGAALYDALPGDDHA